MEPTPSNKSWIVPVVGIIAAVAIVAIVFAAKKPASAPDITPDMNAAGEHTGTSAPHETTNPDATNPNDTSVNINAGTTAITPTERSFTISGGNYFFKPNAISVNRGDTVTINFTNSGGMHDLKIEGYDVGTKVISSGQSASFTFVADKTGSFEYYCSVGNHRAMGMTGTLIVK